MSRQYGKGNDKTPTKSGDEYDAVGPWKKYYCYLARPGVSKNIKRGMRRRARARAKRQIREQLDD